MDTQNPKHSQRPRFGAVAFLSLLAAISLRAQTAAPSDQPAAPKDAPATDEVVTLATFNVTGSHLSNSSTFTSPTPILVVEKDSLQASAPANLADSLKRLPAFAPGGGQTVGGGTGNNSANYLNLRGLGTIRTLTLLDGRRFTPSEPTGEVDSNMIPQSLVSHVDIVTGGASAAYGSDAVGGVVNYVLNKEFTGFKTDVHYGISQRGDNEEYKASLAFGTDYKNGRGHFIFSAEYLENLGISGNGRGFRRTLHSLMPDPADSTKLILADDIQSPYTRGGLIVIGAGGSAANNKKFSGIMFGAHGERLSYNYGSPTNTVGKTSGLQDGGDGLAVGTTQEIVRPLQRRNLFGRTDFKVSDRLTVYFEGAYSESHMDVQNSPTTHTLTIKRNNAYLAQVAPDLVAQMTSLGVTTLTMNRLTLENGLTLSHVNDLNYFGIAGFTAKLGDWTWDGSFQRGTNDLDIPVTNNLITANMTKAADAILSNGTIICASASTDPACVPFNPFGIGAPSQAALAYVMGTSKYNNYTTQSVADTNLSGDLFTLPAGPVSAAFGAQWRKLSSATTSDGLSVAGAYRLANNQPFSGAYTIMEEYAEAQVPIVKDLPLAKRVSANLAFRHTNYSTSGGANTWKVGLVWQLTDELRLRSSWSRDIRAPNLAELFTAGVQKNAVINDSLTGKTYSGVPNITVGNRDLKPERALSNVTGLVYQPGWLKGFSFAVDTYSIVIHDAIYSAGGADAVEQCNRDPGSPLCSFVTRGSTLADPNAVIQVITAPVNLNSQTLKGTDFEASYRVPSKFWSGSFQPGSVRLRLLVSYLDENLLESPLTSTINQAGNAQANASAGLTATPRVKSILSLQQSGARLSSYFQLRYIGRMTWDKTRRLGVDTEFNDVAAAAYLDAQVGYKFRAFGKDVEAYVNVQNVLDKGLVFDPKTGGATPLPTDPSLYDQVGRMFRVGLRTTF